MDVVAQVLLAGLLATIAIDCWATFSNRVLDFPRTNWGMVGRWIGHIPTGKFIHRPIGSSAEINHENVLGWTFHYLIGFSYSALYSLLIFTFLHGTPTLLSAWLFGLATVLSPWFIMQPGLGLGVCAIKAPQPNLVRVNNIVIHSIFGIALYISWLLTSTLTIHIQ